jgi:hypothetical protein
MGDIVYVNRMFCGISRSEAKSFQGISFEWPFLSARRIPQPQSRYYRHFRRVD